MKFHAFVPASVVGLCSLFAAQAAEAHIRLTAPTPRVANTAAIKMGPCGTATRNAARVSTFKPGETVTVEWDETISHPGYFRILFDEDGQHFAKATKASFQLFIDYFNGQKNNTTIDKLPKTVTGTVKDGVTWTLADYWNQHPSGQTKSYSLKVTLPNVTCTNCTLQVIQGMFESSRSYENPETAYYYHCADLILKGDVASNPDAGAMQTPDAGASSGQGGGGGSGGKAQTGGAGGVGGVAGSAGAGGSSSNEAGAGGEGEGGAAGSDDTDKKSGGCTFGGRSSGVGVGLLVAFGLLLFRRRRA